MIAANVVWVLASIGLIVGGLVAPSLFGHALLIAQAGWVAILAEAELIGLRRLAALPA